MAAPRVFGTEQEYGIQLVGVPTADAPHPMHLSNRVIRGYRDATANPTVGYDYADESPLLDQWGFELARADAHPDLLTDEQPLASRMLTNGARFYVDHAHPEFSGPECTSVRDAVAYDRAGDVIMQRAADAVAGEGVIRLFKNNTDGKGQSYGSHENYLVDRTLPFEDIVAGFTPFLATRGVLTGAGRVGRGQAGQEPGFQLTQRADFFEREVGLETTMRRPIINTRDEPHADRRRARRLHVITGDANLAQAACYLRIGSAALVLAALEQGMRLPLSLAHPVRAMRTVSHDVGLAETLELVDGRRLTALDIQEAYADMAAELVAREGVLGEEGPDVVELWRDVIDTLRRDPAEAADRLDWVAKLRLLEGFRERDGLAWDAPKLAAIDLQYSEIDPARGLALALERRGQLGRVVDPSEVEAAVQQPPATTRAWCRGELLRRFGERVMAMNWDSVGVELRGGRRATVRLADPLAGSRDALGERFAAAETLDDAVAMLL